MDGQGIMIKIIKKIMLMAILFSIGISSHVLPRQKVFFPKKYWQSLPEDFFLQKKKYNKKYDNKYWDQYPQDNHDVQAMSEQVPDTHVVGVASEQVSNAHVADTVPEQVPDTPGITLPDNFFDEAADAIPEPDKKSDEKKQPSFLQNAYQWTKDTAVSVGQYALNHKTEILITTAAVVTAYLMYKRYGAGSVGTNNPIVNPIVKNNVHVATTPNTTTPNTTTPNRGVLGNKFLKDFREKKQCSAYIPCGGMTPTVYRPLAVFTKEAPSVTKKLASIMKEMELRRNSFHGRRVEVYRGVSLWFENKLNAFGKGIQNITETVGNGIKNITNIPGVIGEKFKAGNKKIFGVGDKIQGANKTIKALGGQGVQNITNIPGLIGKKFEAGNKKIFGVGDKIESANKTIKAWVGGVFKAVGSIIFPDKDTIRKREDYLKKIF